MLVELPCLPLDHIVIACGFATRQYLTRQLSPAPGRDAWALPTWVVGWEGAARTNAA
ncbi:MAG: hypothetical protein H0W78_19885 [Planctomycetes bacterium]|nr:hypothetical protein [Planctomycetota bacterium]